jgi:hypothetical protein
MKKKKTDAKTLMITSLVGSMCILLSFFYIDFPPFGDVTPASTPLSIVSPITPYYVGIIASLIKGMGISMWTGKWFIELPVGIGDSAMAGFTKYLSLKINPKIAIIIGQLSRYVFTSGIVSFYIGIILFFNLPSPLGGDVYGKFQTYSDRINNIHNDGSFFSIISIVWLARAPSMTLSILLNTILSFLLFIPVQKIISKIMNLDQ